LQAEGWKLLVSLLAGSALVLAFAPFGQYWLAPVAYAVLFIAWRGAAPGAAFRLGYAFGLGSFFAGVYWVFISIHQFGEAPVALAAFLTVGMVAILAVYPGAVGWLAARWFGTEGPLAWLGVLPALWVLIEWVRGWFLSGFGWLAAGYSQTDSWLMAYAPIGGVYGVSWAVLLTAGALAALVLGANKARPWALAAVAVVWGGAFAATDYRWTSPSGQVVSVALLQGNVEQDLKWRPEQLAPTVELYRRMTEEHAGTDLIIWPEAAVPALYEEVSGYLEALAARAAESGSTILLGILTLGPEPGSYQNALLAPSEPSAVYVKRQLVPFGEYFPVPSFVRSWMRLMSLPHTDLLPGADSPPPLELAGERIAATICYESLFGAQQLHYLPDATLLVNVSNDAWFGDSIAPHQHLQIARVRAAEAGRYMLRSTNTGVSAVIDPFGRVVSRLPQFETAALRGSVQGFTGRTPYAVWGNYLVVTAALMALIGAGLAAWRLSLPARDRRYAAARWLSRPARN
jgi:apolipoprotein N-acyltransferase